MNPSDDKNPRIIEIEREIEAFKLRIREMKKELDEQQKEFTPEMVDAEYKAMLERSGFTVDEFDLSHYPFWVSPQEREKLKNQHKLEDPDYPTIDWKKISNKVYLRVFTEEEEAAEAERLRKLKAQQTGQTSLEERTRNIIADRQKDFEEFIGEDVISKIGMLIFCLGIGLMLRYGIEMGVVSEEIRILVGVAISALFLFGAHRLRERNVTFSVLFVMAGVAILFYTTYLAHYYYGMLSQLAAFVFNVLITGIALAFAIYHHRVSLAVFALFGAYATPFILSTGNDDFHIFFAYMLTINAVMMLVAYRKDWLALNQVVFVCTLLIFGGWFLRTPLYEPDMFVSAFTFATLFYLSFFVMMIINALKDDIDFGERDYGIFFINTVYYFVCIYSALHQQGVLHDYIGIFGICLGLFNGGYAGIMHYQNQKDERFFNFLIITSLLLITFSAPSFVSHSAALNRFWLLEGVALLLLARVTYLQILRDAAAIALSLGIVMFGVVWFNYYYRVADTLFFNEAVFTAFFTMAALGGSIALFLGKGREQMVLTFTTETFVGVIGGIAALILYVGGNLELTMHTYASRELTRLHLGIYNTVFALIVWTVVNVRLAEGVKRIADYIVIIALYSYIFITHFSVLALRNDYLREVIGFGSFGLHYVNVALGFAIIYLLGSRFYAHRHDEEVPRVNYMLWAVVGALVFHLSAETDHWVVISAYNSSENLEMVLANAHRTLYILLWAACAFVFMLVGMKYQFKELRMIALTLFGVTLVKFFLFDFPDLSIFSKMLSLIIIGGLMLIVSFLYTHLKDMIENGTLDWNAIAASFTGKKVDTTAETENETEEQTEQEAKNKE